MKIQVALVGAVIGMLSSALPGAIIGFLLGLYVDYIASDESNNSKTGDREQYADTRTADDFTRALLILIAAIMNADGIVRKSELDLVKRMLVRTYGETKTRYMLLILREELKHRQDIHAVCQHVRARMVYSQRVELLQVLFRISREDGEISASELQMLQTISSQLGITNADYLYLKAMFVTSEDSDYKVLELAAGASQDDVKKAYRKLAMKFHPDKQTDLSDTEKKSAQEKFVRVQKAYENISRKRGWN